MTGMKRLIGMPVICEGKHIGSIVRGVLRSDGKALRGLVMRDGLRLSRWIEADNIARPCACPRTRATACFG